MNDRIPFTISGTPPPIANQQVPFDHTLRHPDADGIDPMRILWAVWEHKWLVIMVLIATLCIGLWKYLSTPPRYNASGLMQIETQEAGLPALQQFEQYGNVLGGSVSIAAEIEIIRSRTLMTDVAERLKLDILASP
ncbi:MAG TPA: hypothetical protein DDY14_12265, partial [Chromatiaceae bacterium]|nr:hypothetical protein [Chromatiaceae bacterium]